MAFRQLKRPVAPECASLTPCSAAPSPCLTSGPTFVTLRPWKRTLRLQTLVNAPEGQKRFPISETYCGEAQLDDELMADR